MKPGTFYGGGASCKSPNFWQSILCTLEWCPFKVQFQSNQPKNGYPFYNMVTRLPRTHVYNTCVFSTKTTTHPPLSRRAPVPYIPLSAVSYYRLLYSQFLSSSFCVAFRVDWALGWRVPVRFRIGPLRGLSLRKRYVRVYL